MAHVCAPSPWEIKAVLDHKENSRPAWATWEHLQTLQPPNAPTHRLTYIDVCTHMHMYMHKCTQTHRYIYIQMHIDNNTYAYTCRRGLSAVNPQHICKGNIIEITQFHLWSFLNPNLSVLTNSVHLVWCQISLKLLVYSRLAAAICPVYTSMPSSCINALVPLLVFPDLFSF